jgi:hypothetical protein
MRSVSNCVLDDQEMSVSIQEEIVVWAQGQPAWRQNIIAKSARGQSINDTEISSIADALVDGSARITAHPVQVHDLPTGSVTAKRVSLTAVGGLKNVNALQPGQTLTFGEEGLTIIYGDNGSGKSGYARLIKSAVGARHDERVLPDAFNPTAGAHQEATISYKVENEPYEEKWPVADSSAVRQVHFYDEACGDIYIESDTEVTYRLSMLQIFDDLVNVSDRVGLRLDGLLAENAAKAVALPVLDTNTPSGAFVNNFSRTTSVADIEAACVLPEGAEERLAWLIAEEHRLKATDPDSERRRLRLAASSLEALASGLAEIERLLSPVAQTVAVQAAEDATSFRQAATVASTQDFSEELLGGVGSVTWRALWGAAEAYVKAEIPSVEFPATGTSERCPLCQQQLDIEAGDRMRRFHRFIHNETEKNATESEQRLRNIKNDLANLATASADWSAATNYLESSDTSTATAVARTLTAAVRAKSCLAERLAGNPDVDQVDVLVPDVTPLKTLAKALSDQSDSIDSTVFEQRIAGVEREKQGLQDKSVLAKIKQELLNERARLTERKKIQDAHSAVNTRAVTTKATELTRKYVTTAMGDRFTRESQGLKLEKLMLGDRGGSKAKHRHRPELIGVSGTLRPTDVLSEGEQTALGLAGLFTEVHFDESRSTLVLDDPVCSLDHERRKSVAGRIAEFAKERQVIVFTHDLSFVGYLVKAAENHGVPVAERSIQRSGAREPGFVFDNHPWKAKDVPKRLGNLEAELARIKKECGTWDEDRYLRETSLWAGDLSETLERIIRNDLIYPVVDRATTEVMPRMVKVLVRVTKEDNLEYQGIYGEVSEWAKRHDKSEDTNFVPPTPDELERALTRVRTWFTRIKAYKSN